MSCRALGLSASWFYKWRDRPPTLREDRRAALDAAVRASFEDSDGDYGSPRVLADLYLAAVEDLASRRLAGFTLGERHDAELAAGALKMATAVRGGDVRGIIFHSDRGSEYTAELFGRACRALGVTQSMSPVGSALDNVRRRVVLLHP